jgi:acetyl esterase/lipase
MDDTQFEEWCPELGLLGISVEYRLAPEAPYPAPLDDCYRAFAWVHEHAHELGIDAGRVGVRGPSAGGGLAAGLALLVRDRGEQPLAFQLLESPMLDDRQKTESSNLEGLLVWSKEANTFGWRSYLSDLYGSDDVPVYAAPARADTLSELPPTLLSTSGADGFRDEDILYALQLMRAGVPTELHVYPGAPHGYQMIVDSAAATQARRDIVDWLDRILR